MNNRSKFFLTLIFTFAQLISFAQNSTVQQVVMLSDTSAHNARIEKWLMRDPIWKAEQQKWYVYDTVSRVQYEAVNRGKYQALLDDNREFQHFVLLRRKNALRVTPALGLGVPYCGSWAGTINGRDKTLYGSTGLTASLGIDYLWNNLIKNSGIQLGLGGVLGYQSFYARNDWKDRAAGFATQLGIPSSQIIYADTKPSEDMYLLVGPTASIPLGKKFGVAQDKRLLFDIALRGGLFRTEAAQLAAFRTGSLVPLDQIGPTEKRYHPGGLLNFGLTYMLSENLGIGTQLGIFLSQVGYFVRSYDGNYYAYDRTHGGMNGMVNMSYRLDRKRLIPVTEPVAPTCDVPTIVDGLSGKNFSVAQGGCVDVPFRWQANSSYPNEEFTFNLYEGAGKNTPIASYTGAGNTFKKNICLAGADTTKTYYYTVSSKRTNRVGMSCTSAAAASSFRLSRSVSCPPPPAPACTNSDYYTHNLYNGKIVTRVIVNEVDTLCICGTGEQLFQKTYKRKPLPSSLKDGIRSMALTYDLPNGNPALSEEFKKSLAKYGKNNAVSHFVFSYTIQRVNGCTKELIGEPYLQRVSINRQGRLMSISPIDKKQ